MPWMKDRSGRSFKTGSAGGSTPPADPPPTLTSITPATGPVSTPVTLAGTNLLKVTAVQFDLGGSNAAQGNFSTHTDTAIGTWVPGILTDAGDWQVTATTPTATSNAVTYTLP